MRSKINIQQTFKAIRQLPLEISFEQVEAWVRQEPIAPTLNLFQRIKARLLRWLEIS